MGKKAAREFDYPGTFDRLMGEHFGEEFKTGWNIFAGTFGGYTTTRTNGKRLTKQMERVGRSISNAIAAGQGAADGR